MDRESDDLPFYGDRFISSRVEALVREHRIQAAIETGTHLGSTSRALAAFTPHVFTIEKNADVYVKGHHLDSLSNVTRYCGNSPPLLKCLLRVAPQPVLFYLDARFGRYWPLCDELHAIHTGGAVRPVLAIPDFQVPNMTHEERRYYTHRGKALNLKLIEEHLVRIYGGMSNCRISFNDAKSVDSPCGVLFCEPIGTPVEPRYVLVTTFGDCSQERFVEIRDSLEENLSNPLIDSVVLAVENLPYPLPESTKLSVVMLKTRPTFQNLFDIVSSLYPGRRCIVANGDIAFDYSLNWLSDHDLTNVLVALTRWDVAKDGTLHFFNRRDSQDAWIFQSPMPIRHASFFLGVPGCDNFLAYLAGQHGMQIRNCGRYVMAKHRHLTGIRGYSGDTDRICRARQRTFRKLEIEK